MRRYFLLVLVLFGLLLVPGSVIAQTPEPTLPAATAEGIAVDVTIDDKDVPDGSIISLTEGKYRLSSIPYDPSVFGVVTYNPSAFFDDSSDVTKRPVVAYGKAKVRVSSVNGVIKAGDLVTTSEIKGVGQKATENGYVIGVALEDYDVQDPKKEGTIYVTLHLNFGMLSTTVRENLVSSLRKGAIAPFSSPLNAFRYLVAALIAILSFVGGFWFFGRVSSRGVEAIGRNPLARRFILLSVLLNVALTVSVMLLGVALAYIILVI